MIEVRIHGRGGQGAVVASLIIARAAFHDGYHVQVFPQFGVERRGAPVVAFTRLSRQPIRVRSHIYTPHHILVLDPALFAYIDVTAGLRSNGWIVINTPDPPAAFPLLEQWRVATVDGTTIAAEHGIGTVTQPIVNTAMVGAFIRATGLVSWESLVRAIQETMADRAEANTAAARKAFESVQLRLHPALESIQARYMNL